jgi:hypothetical protein
MTELSNLKRFELLYLASPFTLYDAGLRAAFIDASKLMAKLLSAGIVNVISPIVEAFPISYNGGLNPIDLAIWEPFCAARMAKSDALIVGMLNGWEQSAGTRREIEIFAADGKDIFFLEPTTMQIIYSSRVPA